jgi:two-component system, LytTR family, response regulator
MEPSYRCLIVEDEKPAHEVIKSHISRLDNLQFCKSVYNGKEALDVLKTEQFDIIFLDIEMPIITGMELLQEIQPKPAIIITTAYTDFAFEAYQLEAVDYLQKPISFLRFSKAVDKAIQYVDFKNKLVSDNTTVSVKVESEWITIHVADIMYLTSMGNYLKIIVNDANKPYIVYDSLGNMIDKIGNKNVFQIHKSFAVNSAFIASKNTDSIVLHNTEVLPIGRKYSGLLEKLL